MDTHTTSQALLALDVLQQFRVIYGSMRQYFREVEERCGLSGSQMWVLQEVQRTPGLGVTDLASRLGIRQATCSLLVDKLVSKGCLARSRPYEDQRRVGLCLAANGIKAIDALPGPAQGILPAALASIPDVALKTLNINLSELIRHLPGHDADFAHMPLADMVEHQSDDGDQPRYPNGLAPEQPARARRADRRLAPLSGNR